MTEDQKKKLEQKLWNIANELRGRMDADEFRDYILGFIFYKYLSERLHIYVDGILKNDGRTFTGLDASDPGDREILAAVEDACIEALGYFLKPEELFTAVAQKGAQPGAFILEDLTEILNNIQRSTMGTQSEEDFDNLFEDLDLTSTKLGRTNEARNTLISKVLVHLDGIDFQLESADSDVLGDAYEYLIGKFASGAGKKAGEFYTPQQVSTILAKIVTMGKTRLRSVYDPTCGSGSLLLRVAKEVKDVGDFYGQEMNRTTYNLARMNMILHGVHYRNFDIKQEDTLEHPQHEGMLFESIVANPPFSAKWSANKIFESDDRFSAYGKLAPASKADFAFVQRMLHHLDEDGTMAVVLPHGVLFRGAAERVIREFLIKRNWLDAVIGLPANIFYGTTIPTSILVFRKCKEVEDVQFIDASSCFLKGKNQNSLRDQDVARIVAAYENRAEEDRFSHRASAEEIVENDFNLNIPRYIDSFQPDPKIDLSTLTTNSSQLLEVIDFIDGKISALCSELDIQKPSAPNLFLIQNFKRGLMQHLFSKTLRFTQDDGSAFPDWEEHRLADVATFFKGKGISKSDIVEDGVTPCIRYGEIYTHYRERIFDVVSRTNAPSSGLFLSQSGDVIIPASGEDRMDMARACCVEQGGIALGGDINVLRSPISGDFLAYYLNNARRKEIAMLGQGNSVVHLYPAQLKTLTVEVPCADEQRKIVSLISAVDAKMDAVSGQITHMEAFKKGLLQKLFV